MSTLKKALTLRGLTFIAIGSCIGSGIFITPSETYNILKHPGWVLLLWGIGGLVTMLGALTFAELGARFPKAGGVYVYIKEAFGELPAFLYGWITLFIVNTGALAALGIGLTDYLTFFFPIEGVMKIIIPIVIILSLTGMNILGIKTSQFFASLFTGIKLLAMGFIIVIGLWYVLNYENNLVFTLWENTPDKVLSASLLAFVGVFFSFGGWHHATYLSAEAQDAQRTVPKAMLYGTMTVTLVYLLIIWAFMILVPMQEMVISNRIAGDALSKVFNWGGKLVSIFIAVSIFGTIGIYTMSAPRIYFAMAKDGIFFKSLARIHPTFQTPHIAMGLQALWAVLLVIIWGSFVKVITFVTFMDVAFMALGTASIFIIRRKYPNQESPFSLKWYPLIPILYVLVTVAFVVNTAFHLPVEAFVGIGILLLGIPVYLYYARIKNR